MCEVGAVKQGYQYQISCLLMVVVGVPKCGASSTMPIMVMVHGWWLVVGGWKEIRNRKRLLDLAGRNRQ